MKARNPILLLGFSAAIFCGCASTSPSLAPSSSIRMTGAVSSSAPTGSGDAGSHPSAVSLAHYAAGVSYEWGDQDEKAVNQFYQSALADPGNEALVIQLTERFLKNKETDKALKILNPSARRPGASGELLSWLARADGQAGKLNQALAASNLAIKRQPDGFDGYAAQFEIELRMKDFPACARTLALANRSLPREPVPTLALAGLYSIYIKAQPADAVARAGAVDVLDRASKMPFTSIKSWRGLADFYTQLNLPKKAEAIYLKLLSNAGEPSTDREALHEKLAGIYFEAEDKTNAMKQLEAIVRDDPVRYPRAWFFLGELAFDDDKLTDAAADYENALHWEPDLAEAYFKLVLVDIALHDNKRAFELLETARAKFPDTFVCEFYSGVAYLHAQKYGEAMHHLGAAETIALATNPSTLDYRFYFQFGEACERNKAYAQADQYLQKCIDLNPTFSEALNYLGYMLADQGHELPRARELIERAIHLEPKNGAFLDSLGWVLFKEKQPQRALPWLLKAMELSPEPDAAVLDHLGEVYLALHEPGKALDAWKKSFTIEADPEVKKKINLNSGGV